MLDCRKPVDEYVSDKLTEVIQECFDMRQNVERKMTRQELTAFDRVLVKFL